MFLQANTVQAMMVTPVAPMAFVTPLPDSAIVPLDTMEEAAKVSIQGFETTTLWKYFYLIFLY